MSDSVSKYFEQQEELQTSKRRSTIHKELKALIKDQAIATVQINLNSRSMKIELHLI